MEPQPQTWYEKGCKAEENGQPGLALECYQKFLAAYERGAFSGDDELAVGTYINAGVLLSEQGQDQEACRYHDRAIELKPDFAIAWLNRSIAYTGLGLFDKALTDAFKAIALDPEYIDSQRMLAQIYIYGYRDFAAALKQLEKVSELDVNCGEAYFLRGEALLGLGQTEQALCNFRDALVMGLPTRDLELEAREHCRRLAPEYYQTWDETVAELDPLSSTERRPYDMVSAFLGRI
ncbi:tetratricopeptide repeat protein [Candidatus Haliotispira prima]|uniref:Tetratricopeptide repeat protein n=1 Tax=Candidatus Haliotispira prima TaxID=3034016 RepID=A0ABY8MHU3_9SPIO|nr:tetratricopeptide repeat protein [Candidatus Haliotispira prima]